MNNQLKEFKNIKNALAEDKKAERASLTLKWYRMIQEMLENPRYSDSERYLQSVSEFIEEHETVTDKQIIVLERIHSHPSWD